MYSAFNYLNDIVLLKMLAQLFLFSVDDSPLVAVMIFVQNFTIFFFLKKENLISFSQKTKISYADLSNADHKMTNF